MGIILLIGMNTIKKAMRQSQKIRQGGIIERPGQIHVSNVMLVCPNCDATTRMARSEREDGKRVRVCRKCHKDIDTE